MTEEGAGACFSPVRVCCGDDAKGCRWVCDAMIHDGGGLRAVGSEIFLVLSWRFAEKESTCNGSQASVSVNGHWEEY